MLRHYDLRDPHLKWLWCAFPFFAMSNLYKDFILIVIWCNYSRNALCMWASQLLQVKRFAAYISWFILSSTFVITHSYYIHLRFTHACPSSYFVVYYCAEWLFLVSGYLCYVLILMGLTQLCSLYFQWWFLFS